MGVLFVIKSVRNFSYHSSTIEHLCERGHSVKVIVCSSTEKIVGYPGLNPLLDRFPGKLSVERQVVRPEESSIHWLAKIRELRTFASYLRRKDQSSYYRDRWEGYLSNILKRFVKFPFVKNVLALEWMDEIFRLIERVGPCNPNVLRYLCEERPDLVVGSPVNMVYSLETEYIKAAKRLRIPTVVATLSWDNLTTKGLFHVEPDLLLVWNKIHFEQAVSIHKINPNRIRITGSPFFDKWWTVDDSRTDRVEFCKKVGLDPEKPFLLYLGSAPSISENEVWVVRALAKALKESSHRKIQETQILARPHPSNFAAYEREASSEFRIWPPAGALPDTDESLLDFYQSVSHSEATVGLNTTGMIDAIVIGKPCLSLVLPEFGITQTQAQHFQELVTARTLYLSKGIAEAVTQLEEICIQGEDPLEAYRNSFSLAFTRPLGKEMPAGRHAADAIESLTRLTILTVAYKSEDLLLKNISLTGELNTCRPRWVIVNNDGVPLEKLESLAEESNGEIKVISGVAATPNPYDAGSYHHGAGLMRGMKEIQSRFLLVLDPDFFILRPQWASELLAHVREKGLAFFGSGWDPLNVSKYQRFPSVHCMLVDLAKVVKADLDFTPELDRSFRGRELIRWLHRKLVARRALYVWVNVLASLLRIKARDTGYRIYRRFSKESKCEILQFVQGGSKKASYDETLAQFPRFLRSFVPSVLGIPAQNMVWISENRSWDEFQWKGEIFGVHLRRVANKSNQAEAGASLNAVIRMSRGALSLN